MKNVKTLFGSESGECVVIGSGPSIREVDFKSIGQGVKRIAVNRCFIDTKIDYQIYSDSFFAKWSEEHPVRDDVVLIGLGSKAFFRTDYFFDFETIIEGFHSGFYALQIAQLLGFDTIYLLGFDYYAVDGAIHYYDGKFGTSMTDAERNMYLKVLETDRLIKDFDKVDWTAKIYNCNPQSRLKKFQFRRLKNARV